MTFPTTVIITIIIIIFKSIKNYIKYLERIRLLGLMVSDAWLKGLRCPVDGVAFSRNGGSGAILRGAHELDSSTLHDEVRGGWIVVYVADRVAVAQKPRFIHL